MKNIKCFILLIYTIYLSGCLADSANLATPTTGVAGSYARFIINDDKLYVIDMTSIKTFSLTNPTSPEQIDNKDIGSNIESIFKLDNKLFIGSGSGLYIYEIDNEGLPILKGKATYELPFEPCDPVVATPTYAYVTLNTLNSVSGCGRTVVQGINELKIFDIENIESPQLIQSYPMHNPKGVGIDGSTLFVCDDVEGLKIYNVENPNNIELIKQFSDFTAYDVIPLNGLLLVVATDNIYQFDYTDLNNINLISSIPIQS